MAERHRQLTLALLLATLLAGCATTTPPAPGRPAEIPAPDEQPVLKPVSRSLIEQSRDQQRTGNYGQAAATLERAIRIDPGEPAVWLELARVRYAERNWTQAEQLARKARSLAGSGSPLRDDAIRVIADALREQQRPQEARELEHRLENL